MHSMHFLAIAAGGNQYAFFIGASFSILLWSSEMPGLPSFRGRLSLNAKPDPQTKHQKGKTDGVVK
jgi:hypothetical protein